MRCSRWVGGWAGWQAGGCGGNVGQAAWSLLLLALEAACRPEPMHHSVAAANYLQPQPWLPTCVLTCLPAVLCLCRRR